MKNYKELLEDAKILIVALSHELYCERLGAGMKPKVAKGAAVLVASEKFLEKLRQP